MYVLGLSGSPRSGANSHALLSVFMDRAKALGAQTEIIRVSDYDVRPCEEYTACEKTGRCPIPDDMPKTLYGKIRLADVIVVASPIFFYNMPAQLKALVDRCQLFWARKYRLHLKDPKSFHRKGIVLSCGATHGQHLFDGLLLTTKYFFDAVDATPSGEVLVRSLEHKGEALTHPTASDEIHTLCDTVLLPLQKRPTWAFYHKEDPQKALIASLCVLQHTKGAINAIALHEGDPIEVNTDFQTQLKDRFKMDAMYFHTKKDVSETIDTVIEMNGTRPTWVTEGSTVQWPEPNATVSPEWLDWLITQTDRLYSELK